MSLPCVLYPGQISIYGVGSTSGTSGIIPGNIDILFGLVNQVSGGGQSMIKVGQSVMYNKNDITDIVNLEWQYTILPEDKIILIEGTGAVT